MPLQLTYKRGDKFRHTVEHRGGHCIAFLLGADRPSSNVGDREAHTKGSKLRSPKVRIAPKRVAWATQNSETVVRREAKGLRLKLCAGHPGFNRPLQLFRHARATSGLYMHYARATSGLYMHYTRLVRLMVRARGMGLAHLGYSASAHASISSL